MTNYAKLLYEAYGYQLEESSDLLIQQLLRKLRSKQITDVEMAKLVRTAIRTGKRVRVSWRLNDPYPDYIISVSTRKPQNFLLARPREELAGNYFYELSEPRAYSSVWLTLNELLDERTRFDVVEEPVNEDYLAESDIDVRNAVRQLIQNMGAIELWKRAIRVARRNGKIIGFDAKVGPHKHSVYVGGVNRSNEFIWSFLPIYDLPLYMRFTQSIDGLLKQYGKHKLIISDVEPTNESLEETTSAWRRAAEIVRKQRERLREIRVPRGKLQSTDVKLRQLERQAHQSTNALKRYIRTAKRHLGDKEAVTRLIRDFHVLPGVEVDIHIHPETGVTYQDAAGNEQAVEWVRKELEAGNEYAWCQITVYVYWGLQHGMDRLGAVSARNRNDATQLAYEHGMVQEAVRDLLSNIKVSPLAYMAFLGDYIYRNYLKRFLRGIENEDWIRM